MRPRRSPVVHPMKAVVMSKTCISGKIGYPHKGAAIAASKHVHFCATQYECPYCHQWHLAGERQRRPRERGRHESMNAYARRMARRLGKSK